MKTIVIGAGEVGFHIAERLSREGHDIVIIERDPATRERVQERLDVMTVEGNGSSPRALEEAGIRDADLIIAVADIDEVNISACILAKEYGVPRRIARVRDPDFSESPFLDHGRRLGIDLLINPNIVVADEIVTLIKTPAAAEVGRFAEGRVLMLGLQIGESAPIVDRRLRTLRAFHATTPFLVVAIYRHGKFLIPRGETMVEAGDHVYFISKRESINAILTLLGKRESIVERVFLVGGGRVGLRVAQQLERDQFHTRLMERNTERCDELSRLLSQTLVLKGDGTDIRSLMEEGIADADAVATVTDDEGTNILAALLAKEQGAKKAIALIKRAHLLHLLPHLGIDAAVSPRVCTANVILRYVRKGRVVSIFEIPESEDAETLEMVVPAGSRVAGKSIGEAGLPSGAIIGAVVHRDEILIPTGGTVLHPDDRIVVFAFSTAIAELGRLFA
jgi:trk system potassium uptake protein TrkA